MIPPSVWIVAGVLVLGSVQQLHHEVTRLRVIALDEMLQTKTEIETEIEISVKITVKATSGVQICREFVESDIQWKDIEFP